jgi:hypothetical protein
MARRIVAADGSADNRAMRLSTTRRIATLLLGLGLALGLAAACNPLPNPNPSSPANQLPGVGSPNVLSPRGSTQP